MIAPESWPNKSDSADKPLDAGLADKPTHELADIFRLYGAEYRRTHPLTRVQLKAMHNIEFCRTSVFGWHVDQCDACGHIDISYNSCRNRNCPKCQGSAQHVWVEQQVARLLPVPYYHAVFTVPNQIFPIAIYNQRLIYELMFACMAATLFAFGRDPHWLGAGLGFTALLHTWGQLIPFHPHLHIIIPGGGLDENGKWVWPQYGGKFLFPVKALAKVFRGKFIAGLKKLYYDGQLELPADVAARFADVSAFEAWIDELVGRDWVAWCHAPMAGPAVIVRYLGRYTHRTAISNRRILSIDNGQISFSYKDYKDGGEQKVMTLSADEFITRFLYHVLPPSFHRIRHYGFLTNSRVEKNLVDIRRQLAPPPTQPVEVSESARTSAEPHRVVCPHCGQGRLIPILIVHPWGTIVPSNSHAGVDSS